MNLHHQLFLIQMRLDRVPIRSPESIVTIVMHASAAPTSQDVNQYGVPLHACNGYRHDEHYWAWVASWCGDGSGRRPKPESRHRRG